MMDIEQLKLVLGMLSQTGEGAKEAFLVWLFMTEGLSFLVYIAICFGFWRVCIVAVDAFRGRSKGEKELEMLAVFCPSKDPDHLRYPDLYKDTHAQKLGRIMKALKEWEGQQ